MLVWVMVAGIVVAAVVVLALVDRGRAPMTCAGCGEAKPFMVKKRVDGRSVWMCGDCRKK